MLKKGDKVVMHTCLEARIPKYQGKIWTCQSDEFTAVSGERVVFLEGFSGYFAAEFLQKVNFPELRDPLMWFASQMEIKLQENDHKGGWEKCHFPYLHRRLIEEVMELRTVYEDQSKSLEDMIRESADVANFAMMIADRARQNLSQR